MIECLVKLLKFSVKCLIPSICETFYEIQEKRGLSPLLGTEYHRTLTHPRTSVTQKDTETDSQHSLLQTVTASDPCNRHAGDRGHREHEGEYLNMDLPLSKLFKGKFFYFFSLM